MELASPMVRTTPFWIFGGIFLIFHLVWTLKRNIRHVRPNVALKTRKYVEQKATVFELHYIGIILRKEFSSMNLLLLNGLKLSTP